MIRALFPPRSPARTLGLPEQQALSHPVLLTRVEQSQADKEGRKEGTLETGICRGAMSHRSSMRDATQQSPRTR